MCLCVSSCGFMYVKSLGLRDYITEYRNGLLVGFVWRCGHSLYVPCVCEGAYKGCAGVIGEL